MMYIMSKETVTKKFRIFFKNNPFHKHNENLLLKKSDKNAHFLYKNNNTYEIKMIQITYIENEFNCHKSILR